VKITESGRSLHLALIPLRDAGRRHIGDLVVMRDITALEFAFQWSIAIVTAIGLLAAIGMLGAFYLALDRVEQDYRRQHDLEHQLLRLNAQHSRILQLEKLSALGTMVGGIAHQLNNPLVGVVNLAQLAEREADDPARIARSAAGNSQRRRGLPCDFVKRMLGFSKVSCFDSRPTPMAELIEDTVLLFRQTESQASAGRGETAGGAGGARRSIRPDPPRAVQPARQRGAGDTGPAGAASRSASSAAKTNGQEPVGLDIGGHRSRPAACRRRSWRKSSCRSTPRAATAPASACRWCSMSPCCTMAR
jgi:hypothetical protein